MNSSNRKRTAFGDLRLGECGLLTLAFLALERVIRAFRDWFLKQRPGRVTMVEDEFLMSLRMYTLYIMVRLYKIPISKFKLEDLPVALPLPNCIAKVLDCMASYVVHMKDVPRDVTGRSDYAGWGIPYSTIPSSTLRGDWEVWRSDLLERVPEHLISIARVVQTVVLANHPPGLSPPHLWSYLDWKAGFFTVFPSSFDPCIARLLHCEDSRNTLDYYRFVAHQGSPVDPPGTLFLPGVCDEKCVGEFSLHDPAEWVAFYQMGDLSRCLAEDYPLCSEATLARPPIDFGTTLLWSFERGWLSRQLALALTLTRPKHISFDRRVPQAVSTYFHSTKEDRGDEVTFARLRGQMVSDCSKDEGVTRGREHVARLSDFLQGTITRLPKGRYLDFGCGDCSVTRTFMQHFGYLAKDVTCVDVRPPKASVPGVSFQPIDPQASSLQSLGKFGVITAFNVLHHTPFLYEVLGAIRSVMEPDSLFVVKEHDCPSDEFATFLDIVHQLYENVWSDDPHPETWAEYRCRDEWRLIFKLLGFEIVASSSVREVDDSPFRAIFFVLKCSPGPVFPFDAFLTK